MISKPIDKITKADIEALITDQVQEGRTIEYKECLPGGSDDDKRKFLEGVSSFANTGGGDLLYGIRATDGVPQEAVGLECNLDADKLRLENLIRDCLDPRIPGVRIQPLAGFPKGPVFLIRIPRSWVAPHMITFKNRPRFFTRNSAGKQPMDVTEIRSAFLLSESLTDKIKRFRDERLSKIIAGETPVPLSSGPKVVLHILPIASFTGEINLDLSVLRKDRLYPKLICSSSGDSRYNIDGLLTHRINSPDNTSPSYCQIYRTGKSETVGTSLTSSDASGKLRLHSTRFESEIIEVVFGYFEVLKRLTISSPLLVFISMLGVLGTYLQVDENRRLYFQQFPIDRDTLLLPDILIEEYTTLSDQQAVAKMLHPAFDAMWNACGYERSFNYDEHGNWMI